MKLGFDEQLERDVEAQQVGTEQCQDCDQTAVMFVQACEGYCEEHYAHKYCECGQSLGEYKGEGFCKRCQ